MAYIEVIWCKDKCGLTYISENVKALIGYTVEELKALAWPLEKTLAPSYVQRCNLLVRGKPNTIASHIFPLVLRHKNGSEIHCEATAICQYDSDGDLTEMSGVVRRAPQQRLLNDILGWWKSSLLSRKSRQLIHRLIDTLTN